MGYYTLQDPSGLTYDFKIAGDQPSADEQSRMQSIMAGQQAQPTQPEQPGLGSTIKGGIGSLIAQTEGGVARMGQGYAETHGGSLFGVPSSDYEQYAEDKAKENEEYEKMMVSPFKGDSWIPSPTGIVGSAVQSSPAMAGSAIGATLGAPLGPLGIAAGAFLGGAIPMIPSMFEQNIQEQKQANDKTGDADKPIDWSKATAATATQGLVEGASDIVPFHAAGFFTKDVIGKAVNGAVKTLAKTGVAASKTALSEGAEEAVQQALQRWQAGENLGDKEALTSYLQNAIVGGVIGGGFGGAVGFTGARQDAKSARQMSDAFADANAESLNTQKMAATNIPAAEARRAAPYADEPEAPQAPVEPFGLLTDRSQQQTAVQTGLNSDNAAIPEGTDVGDIEKPETLPHTEGEYTSAIDMLRGKGLISPDKIKTTLKVGTPKANSIFQEMLKRNDAIPAGSLGQYAKIITPKGIATKTGSTVIGDVSGTARDYIVKPVDRADETPYSLTVNGKNVKAKKFQTHADAEAFAKTNNLSDYTVQRDNTPQQYGIYSQHYRMLPGGAEQLTGSQVVETHPTIEEANEAVKKYDPAYSPETNRRKPVLTQDEKNARIKEDTDNELGTAQKAIQSHVDSLVGPDKAAVRVVPNMAGPTPNSIAEGSTVELSRMKNGVRQLVTVNHDLFNGDQNAINQVATHEVVHVLRNADLLTKKEWDDLYDTALNKKVPGKSYTFAQLGVARNTSTTPDANGNPVHTLTTKYPMEEAIAEMLRYHFKDPTAFDKPVRGRLGKLVDFIRKITGLTKRHNGDDVMQAILGGKMASRPEGFGGLGPRKYAGSPIYSKVVVPPMYMQSDKFIQSVKQERGTPEQWKGIFKNAGLKKEELEWLGLDQWLDNQQGSVNKGDIADFIRANALTDKIASEKRFDLSSNEKKEYSRLLDQLHNAYRDDVNSYYQPFDEWIKEEAQGYGIHSDQARRVIELGEKRRAALESNAPAHIGTTQPGGDNYIEHLFRLPGLQPEFARLGHFRGASNVLVSARTKERTFGDNKKYLFIEEIQSDLHQSGRRHGYVTKNQAARYKELNEQYGMLREQVRAIRTEGDRVFDEGDEDKAQELYQQSNQIWDQLDRMGQEMGDMENAEAPDAPLKSNWTEFAFKNLLRHAVENGYDGISWHGEPESVAATEKYHNVIQGKDERGNPTYTVGTQEDVDQGYGQPVTGVMNLYLTKLPSFVKKYVKQWGLTPEHVQPKKGRVVLSDYIQNADDFGSLFAAIGAEDFRSPVFTSMNKVYQVVQGQRHFDIDEAVSKAKIDPQPIIDFIKTFEQETGGTGQTDQHGNPIFDRYDLAFNDEIKDSVLHEGQPIWSAVSTERMEEIKEDPNFQNWFGNSIVVQPNGDPKVVYHGTQADVDFSRFKKLSHFGTLAAAGDRLSNVTYDRMADRWLKKNPIGEGAEGSFTNTPNFQRHLARIYGKWDDAKPLVQNLRDSTTWWEGLPPDEKMQLIFKHDPEVAEKMRIYPVFLSIKNPLKISDDGDDHTIDDLIIYAETAGAITPGESYRLRHSAGGGANFLALLKRKGYDGFVYTNGVEDVGSTSYIPFDAEQIKSVYNRGTWNGDDPRIHYSSVATPQEFYSSNAPMGQRVPQAIPQDRLAEVTAKVTYNNVVPILQKMNNLLPDKLKIVKPKPFGYDKFETTFIALQDRMLPWAKLVDRMKANGGFITNENDPYFRETLFAGQTDDRLQRAEKDFYQPLLKTISQLPVHKADVDEASRLNDAAKSIIMEYGNKHQMALTELYLYAQHAQERNTEMRKRNEEAVGFRPDQYEHGSGMSDVEAQTILNWFDSKPFGQLFNSETDPNSIRSMFRKLIGHTNDVRVAGHLNPEFRGTDKDVYKDYAPLRSWVEEHMDADEDALAFAKAGKGYNIRGNEDPHALGRQRLAANIIGNAIMQNEEAIIRAGKNEVSGSVLKLIRDNPDMMEGFAESIESRPTKWAYDPKKGIVHRVPDTSIRTDPNVLTVKEVDPNNPDRIKETYIRFKDDRLAAAITTKASLGNAGVGPLVKYALGLNRLLGSLATSYNPEFVISNMLRDLQVATLNLSEYEMKGLRTQVIKSVFPALNGVYHAQRSGNFDTDWAKTFDEFRKNGGMSAWMGLRDLTGTIDRVNKAVTADPKNGLSYSKKAIHALGNFIEDTNLAVENGTRLAAYKALRDRFLAMTNDPTDPKNIKRAQEQAAFAAKEMTVNFNRGGSIKPLANAFYLFFNASMQGSMALLNPMIRSKKMRKMVGGLIVAGLMQDLLMSALSPEDDDGLKTYDKIPDYILEHNFVLLDPFGLSDRGYLKIPMPYLMNAFFNAGRMTSKAMRGGASPGAAVYSVMGTMLDSLNPFGSGGNKFLNFVAPTFMDPLVDVATNTDFTGKHIAPEENIYGGGDKASQRYWNNTNPAYVHIADWLSRLTGGDGKYIPGGLEYSPNVIEYWAHFAGGGALTTVQRAVDLMLPGKHGNIYDILSGQDFSMNDVPMARRFLGNVSERSNTELYMNKRDEVMSVLKEVKDAAKDGDRDRYISIMQNYPDEYRTAIQIQNVEKARKQIGRKINQVRQSKLPDEQKSALIKSLKDHQDELVGQGNYLMRAIR